MLTDIISTTITAVSDGIDSEEEALMWSCFAQVYLQEVRLARGSLGVPSVIQDRRVGDPASFNALVETSVGMQPAGSASVKALPAALALPYR